MDDTIIKWIAVTPGGEHDEIWFDDKETCIEYMRSFIECHEDIEQGTIYQAESELLYLSQFLPDEHDLEEICLDRADSKGEKYELSGTGETSAPLEEAMDEDKWQALSEILDKAANKFQAEYKIKIPSVKYTKIEGTEEIVKI